MTYRNAAPPTPEPPPVVVPEPVSEPMTPLTKALLLLALSQALSGFSQIVLLGAKYHWWERMWAWMVAHQQGFYLAAVCLGPTAAILGFVWLVTRHDKGFWPFS